jgi:cobalt-zinc-cadmium efflux system protein
MSTHHHRTKNHAAQAHDEHHHGRSHHHGDGQDHAHHHHSHSHTHGISNERRLGIALLITGSFMLVELVGGLIAGSLTLLADAAHMLTDAASLALALFALRMARRPADGIYSYGHHRHEVLAAFVNGLALLLLSVWIMIEALRRLWSPQPVAGGLMLTIAALGFAANLASFLVLRDGHDTLNLRGALLHVLGDLLGSAAAIAGALVILTTGWMPIDPLLSIAVSLLILRSGWRVTRESARILLEGAPSGLDPAEIATDLVAQVPGVSGVHHVHAWSLTDQRPVLTLHAVLREDGNRDAVLAQMQVRLRQRFGVIHATVQIEQSNCAGPDHEHGCHQHTAQF